MPDCIRDRTRGASDSNFTHALDSEGIHVRVAFLNKDRFDRGHRRHEALGRVQPDPRRLGLVARRQERSAFRRGLERLA
jgi:hypothetical protein